MLHVVMFFLWCLVSSSCWCHRTFLARRRRRLWNDLTRLTKKLTSIFYGSQAAHLLPSILKIGVTLKEEESRTWLVAHCKGYGPRVFQPNNRFVFWQLLVFTFHEPPDMWCSRMPKDIVFLRFREKVAPLVVLLAWLRMWIGMIGEGSKRLFGSIWCIFQRSSFHIMLDVGL